MIMETRLECYQDKYTLIFMIQKIHCEHLIVSKVPLNHYHGEIRFLKVVFTFSGKNWNQNG